MASKEGKKEQKGSRGGILKYFTREKGEKGRVDQSAVKTAAHSNASKGAKDKTTSKVRKEKPNRSGPAATQGKPGNQSQIKLVVSGNPFLQFGRISQEFLNCDLLEEKSITSSYEHKSQKWVIMLKFKKRDGIALGPEITLTSEEYLEQRLQLLGKTDQTDLKYAKYLLALKDRLMLDLSSAKPKVKGKYVIEYISNHLSPLERGLISLTDTEWATINTVKVGEYETGIQKLFPRRQESLVREISGLSVPSKEPDWSKLGQLPVSKAVLLAEYKIQRNEEDDQKFIERILNLEKPAAEESIDSTPSALKA